MGTDRTEEGAQKNEMILGHQSLPEYAIFRVCNFSLLLSNLRLYSVPTTGIQRLENVVS